MKIKVVTILIGVLILFVFSGLMIKDGIKGTVICFGDSITYGALVDEHSWVYYLSEEHKNINFVNAGRSGRKTSDKQELIPVLKKYSDADYFLIFLGVNDLKNGNDSMVNSCVENMKWMVNEIKKTNEKTDIVILAPVDISLETMNELNIGKKYNENTKISLVKLETKYNELAKEDSLGFISLLKSVSPQNYVDGVHPDTIGQKQIAKAVYEGLNKLFN